MNWLKQQSRQENLMYLVMWGMLFAAPMLSLYIRSASNADIDFQWWEVFLVWRQFAVYLLLFLVHNYLLAPLLVYSQKRLLYFTAIAAIVAAFVLYQCHARPDGMRHGPHHMEHFERMAGDRHGDRMMPPDMEGQNHEPGPAILHHRKHLPPAVIGEHDIVATVVLILMLGMNIGIKLFFKTRNDQKKLVELEKENLHQQLEYLKYQINPHFFMNTLNNIHALVDIDAEKAKTTIVELSKMMRFILYEGNKNGVSLTREFDFIRNYITLMRLRYTDKVKITVDLPAEVPDRTVPPLMLISFIENAFKHGISYQRPSFIDVRVTIEDNRLHFTCHNSKADKSNEERGGVGLANVKQRLELLFDSNYTLNINDQPDTYHVELTIPLA